MSLGSDVLTVPVAHCVSKVAGVSKGPQEVLKNASEAGSVVASPMPSRVLDSRGENSRGGGNKSAFLVRRLRLRRLAGAMIVLGAHRSQDTTTLGACTWSADTHGMAPVTKTVPEDVGSSSVERMVQAFISKSSEKRSESDSEKLQQRSSDTQLVDHSMVTYYYGNDYRNSSQDVSSRSSFILAADFKLLYLIRAGVDNFQRRS